MVDLHVLKRYYTEGQTGSYLDLWLRCIYAIVFFDPETVVGVEGFAPMMLQSNYGPLPNIIFIRTSHPLALLLCQMAATEEPTWSMVTFGTMSS